MDVSGFKVLRVKFNKESKTCHQILFKQHKVRSQNVQKPPDRTLFLINVPPYCNEACFKRIFSPCGKVVKVYFHKNPNAGVPPQGDFFDETEPPKGFKVAYIVFSHSSGVNKALALDLQKEYVLSTEEEPVVTGIEKWYEETRAAIPDSEVLKVEIEKIMAEYDRKKEEATKKKNEEADDEGWVTVSNEKKKKPRVEKLNDVEKKRSKKKKKKKELINFYSFQEREKKMEHLATLRKKFEDDKKRIAQMRAMRKFKPY